MLAVPPCRQSLARQTAMTRENEQLHHCIGVPTKRRMRLLVAVFLLCAACLTRAVATAPPPEPKPSQLRSVDELTSSTDPTQRALVAFAEASRVLTHPRCVNCHPPDDQPRQLDAHEPHQPMAERWPSALSAAVLPCSSCHQDKNLELSRVPGAPNWSLAPTEMAWLHRTAAQICEQLKDPSRNGHKSLEQVVEHGAHDPLVAWGWAPGHGRTPAPGTQARFGELLAEWVKGGAPCPPVETK